MTKKVLEAYSQKAHLYMKKLATPGTILVLEEKHGDRFFRASTVAELGAAALKIVRERLDSDIYYFEEGDESKEWELIKAATNGVGDPCLAFYVLRIRSDGEYEGYDFETLEVV